MSKQVITLSDRAAIRVKEIMAQAKEQIIGVWDLGISSDSTVSETKTSLSQKLDKLVISWIFDTKVKEFIKRSLEKDRNGEEWLESVSSHLVGKLPDKWSDDDIPIFIVLPAFILSELKTAFQISFLLFIPFVVVDLIDSFNALAKFDFFNLI